MVIPWLFPASTIVSSVLLVFRLEVEGVIYLSPLKKLRPEFASRCSRARIARRRQTALVRPDPLVRNDLVRGIPTAHRKERSTLSSRS